MSIFTVTGRKGGVGKSTTAVHLATFLQGDAPTALIDGDPNRSATAWARRGEFAFPVVDERQAVRAAREYTHLVIDTAAQPSREDLAELAAGCDLLILPTSPDALALDALLRTVEELRGLGAERYRVLLTMCPPRPSRDAEDARAMLEASGLPVFRAQIRRAVAFQKAALAGLPVCAVNDPRSVACWGDYVAVGRELLP